MENATYFSETPFLPGENISGDISESRRCGNALTRADIVDILKVDSAMHLSDILSFADRIRESTVGQNVHLRALIEISSFCIRNCLYCGLRKNNTRLKRYRMTEDEIVAAARNAVKKGMKTIVLQSGEDPGLTPRRVAGLVHRIKSEMDVAITLSLGEYRPEDYAMMKAAGADRYLLKHETSDPVLYRAMHPGDHLEDRLKCLRALVDTGFQAGSGIIIGLPGQNIESIADDIILMRDIGVGMAGIGPLIPHQNTPLAGHLQGSFKLVLKAVAAARITMPHIHIPATTATGCILQGAIAIVLGCGANVFMENHTPTKYRELFELYPGRAEAVDNIGIRELLFSIERPPAPGFGHCVPHA